MKVIRLNIDVIARTYGVDIVREATVELNEKGQAILVIAGEARA